MLAFMVDSFIYLGGTRVEKVLSWLKNTKTWFYFYKKIYFFLLFLLHMCNVYVHCSQHTKKNIINLLYDLQIVLSIVFFYMVCIWLRNSPTFNIALTIYKRDSARNDQWIMSASYREAPLIKTYTIVTFEWGSLLRAINSLCLHAFSSHPSSVVKG